MTRSEREAGTAPLALADGRTLRGAAIGAEGASVGEAVFDTGMTGYQETLTDPSYCGQVVTMTAPEVGNTGMNAEDAEANRVQVAGFVVHDPTVVPVAAGGPAARSRTSCSAPGWSACPASTPGP